MRTLLPQLRRLAVVLSALLLFAAAAQAAEPDFVPSAELLAAAKREGKIVLYTANFLDTEQAADVRSGDAYESLIARLSQQSVVKHFDAYADVPWDDPEYRIDPEDPRWELSDDDPLGQTSWYRQLPASTRARIGCEASRAF